MMNFHEISYYLYQHGGSGMFGANFIIILKYKFFGGELILYFLQFKD